MTSDVDFCVTGLSEVKLGSGDIFNRRFDPACVQTASNIRSAYEMMKVCVSIHSIVTAYSSLVYFSDCGPEGRRLSA